VRRISQHVAIAASISCNLPDCHNCRALSYYARVRASDLKLKKRPARRGPAGLRPRTGIASLPLAGSSASLARDGGGLLALPVWRSGASCWLSATNMLRRSVLLVLLLCGLPCAAVRCDFTTSPRFGGGAFNTLMMVRDRRGEHLLGTEHEVPSGALSSSEDLCRPAIVVQTDTREPSQTVLDFIRSGLASADTESINATQQAWVDASVAINAAYAALHGYAYVFGKITGKARRSAQWQKVPILRALATQCPSSRLLFLDSDAYVRAFTERIRSHSAGMAGAFDSSWLKENGDRCMSMLEHNAAFQAKNSSPAIEMGLQGRSSVNTGVLFFPNPAKTEQVLSAWWEQTQEWTEWDDKWPREQQALSLLLMRNSTLRQDVLLLDPLFYGGASPGFASSSLPQRADSPLPAQGRAGRMCATTTASHTACSGPRRRWGWFSRSSASASASWACP
jgi:galactosyl transferase GMA12/MNN10 family